MRRFRRHVVDSVANGPSLLSHINSLVDHVILMTYDYSVSRGVNGPNAPISISLSVIRSFR